MTLWERLELRRARFLSLSGALFLAHKAKAEKSLSHAIGRFNCPSAQLRKSLTMA